MPLALPVLFESMLTPGASVILFFKTVFNLRLMENSCYSKMPVLREKYMLLFFPFWLAVVFVGCF
jgi:hypothetical protein